MRGPMQLQMNAFLAVPVVPESFWPQSRILYTNPIVECDSLAWFLGEAFSNTQKALKDHDNRQVKV